MSVTELPVVVDLSNIPACLRQLAQQIDSGTVNAQSVMILLDKGYESPDYCAFGNEFDGYKMIGLMEAIKHMLIANSNSSSVNEGVV